MTATARRTDPQTSHDAARSLTDLRESQRVILGLLEKFGPGTDDDIARWYRRHGRALPGTPRRRISPSGLRTRRHELVEHGLVTDTGQRVKLHSGRHAIVWAAR